MENKNYVVVEHERKYEYDSIKDIIKDIFGNDYYELSENEKYEKLRLRTYMNAGNKKIPIMDLKKQNMDLNINEKDIYILLNEKTFLLSLAKNKDIVIFEKESNKELAKDIDTSNLRKVQEEYIVINDCVNEILNNEIQSHTL